MSARIGMHQFTLQNEGHGLEPTMRMRAEWQALIVRGINLRPMVIEEEKRVDLLHARARNWPARDEIRDVVAM